jgi:hypothetical protein
MQCRRCREFALWRVLLLQLKMELCSRTVKYIRDSGVAWCYPARLRQESVASDLPAPPGCRQSD